MEGISVWERISCCERNSKVALMEVTNVPRGSFVGLSYSREGAFERSAGSCVRILPYSERKKNVSVDSFHKVH